MKILFVGFAVNDEIFKEICQKDRNSHVSAHKLQWNIIRGIENASGQNLDIVSSMMVSDFPSYPHIFIRGRKWYHCQACDDVLIPFINIILLKHITRFFSCFWVISKWLLKNRKESEKKILIYALHSPHVFATILATKLFGGRTALVIPDMPLYMDMGLKRNWIRSIMKPIDNYILTISMKTMGGLVVLTEKIAKEFAPKVPYIVVEGAISFNDIKNNLDSVQTNQEVSVKIILFAGRLTEIAGLRLLLHAFSMISDPHYRLWIYGKGPMEEEIKEACKTDTRIMYGGLIPSEELMKISKRATVLVSLGLSANKLIHYSFPSKMIEYMKTGTPVIATAPGVPSEYFDYIYLLNDETPAGLATLLQEVCSKNPIDLLNFGKKSKEWVESNKNYLTQGQKIFELLQKI